MYPDYLHIVEVGGIFLRPLLLALSILLIAYIVKTDLSEGTLAKTEFYHEEEQECQKEVTTTSVAVEVHKGDTLQSLFTLHPSPVEITFLERLAFFYKLNPHLRKQALLPGEIVTLPILLEQPSESCSK